MADLFKLAAAILVEFALARQDMQFLEQFDRLAGDQRFGRRWGRGLAAVPGIWGFSGVHDAGDFIVLRAGQAQAKKSER